MKKIFFTAVLACFTLISSAQLDRSIEKNEWIFSLGMNAINSLGSKNPVKSPGDWAFRFPLSASVETRWAEYFSLEIAFNLNGFKADSPIDAAGPTDENLTYLSLDTSLKYYFGEYILPETEQIDFYASAGLGYFKIQDSNISVNVGGGVLYWFDARKSFGIKAQGVGKFAFDHKNTGNEYPNNHFQYSLQLMYRM